MRLLDELREWRRRYGAGDTAELEALLRRVAQEEISGAAPLIELHETLLFLRAYPHSEESARLAEEALSCFSRRVAGCEGDTSAFEEADAAGIAGTSVSAVYSYEVARSLAARYGDAIDIDWEWCADLERVGPVLPVLAPEAGEEWPVEAHFDAREWIEGLKRPEETSLGWIMDRLAKLPITDRQRGELYDRMNVMLTWRLGNSPASRTRARLRGQPLFVHEEPLVPRRAVSLAQELDSPELPVKRIPLRETRAILDLVMDTSAVRYRELYGFSHPDLRNAYHAQAGRGVEIVFFGVPPGWRLPLRAYHAGMFFKNGVPAGYIETLSFFERAEVGFNLYYTFREGEAAWLYARLLRLCRQMLGVTCFWLDPYQIGHENEEAIESGAFWFYRKLGFRSVDPQLARLTEAEERRIAARTGYRTPARTLRKLAARPMIYEMPGMGCGEWDDFHIRRLALARWPVSAKRAFEALREAKQGPEEAQYLRLMQADPALRETLLRLGSAAKNEGRNRSGAGAAGWLSSRFSS